MGTRGFRVVRFRKRYYIFFNQFDSYPDGLGKQVAAQIPADAKEYQQWLDAQRKSAEKWEALYEDFLSIKPGNQVTTDIPDFMRQNYPTLLAPLNDTWIEWIYTVDLDREVFSVDNGAHFKLDRVPHIDWINSLADGDLGDKISLPGAVPFEALSNLVVKPNLASGELSGTLDDLSISDVSSSFRYCMVDHALILFRLPYPSTRWSFLRISKTFLGVNAMDQSLEGLCSTCGPTLTKTYLLLHSYN